MSHPPVSYLTVCRSVPGQMVCVSQPVIIHFSLWSRTLVFASGSKIGSSRTFWFWFWQLLKIVRIFFSSLFFPFLTQILWVDPKGCCWGLSCCLAAVILVSCELISVTSQTGERGKRKEREDEQRQVLLLCSRNSQWNRFSGFRILHPLQPSLVCASSITHLPRMANSPPKPTKIQTRKKNRRQRWEPCEAKDEVCEGHKRYGCTRSSDGVTAALHLSLNKESLPTQQLLLRSWYYRSSRPPGGWGAKEKRRRAEAGKGSANSDPYSVRGYDIPSFCSITKPRSGRSISEESEKQRHNNNTRWEEPGPPRSRFC